VLLLVALGAAIVARSATSAATVKGWRIDEARTSIGFTIAAIGYPTTHGRFGHFSGRILLDFDHPANSFTSFTVFSASVDVGSPSFNDFVKSAALLNADQFPTLSFTSTYVEKLDDRTARITGDLTMLGVTKPIVLMVTVNAEGSGRGRAVAFVATATISRSRFGMIFGIPLIDDTLEISVKTNALANE
jgi:polyisoprenoid-binding protein YceI